MKNIQRVAGIISLALMPFFINAASTGTNATIKKDIFYTLTVKYSNCSKVAIAKVTTDVSDGNSCLVDAIFTPTRMTK